MLSFRVDSEQASKYRREGEGAGNQFMVAALPCCGRHYVNDLLWAARFCAVVNKDSIYSCIHSLSASVHMGCKTRHFTFNHTKNGGRTNIANTFWELCREREREREK